MRIFGLGPMELGLIVAALLLLFGPKRLPQLGKSIGKTVKAIREGVDGEGEDEDAPAKTESKSDSKASAKAEADDEE